MPYEDLPTGTRVWDGFTREELALYLAKHKDSLFTCGGYIP